VHLLDELFDHLLGDDEVGDHAVFHRPDRLQIARGLPQHLLGRLPDGLDHFLAGGRIDADRHDRGLIEHDAAAAHVDEGVGRAKVDRQIVGKQRTQKTEHVGSLEKRKRRHSPA